MAKRIDISNQRFGKWLVLKMVKLEGKSGYYAYCKCDCGNYVNVLPRSMKSGRSNSCGCETNQSKIIQFKRDNPLATPQEIMKERIKIHTKWMNDCLEWTSSISKNGYGLFEFRKKMMNASRAAWIAEYGEIPSGLCVLHHCDNRKCCRISHMFLGSHKHNTEDMIQKGRDNWETCRKFPLGTREKVWEMRQSGKLYREIAKDLKLTMDQVKSLLQNQKRHMKKR